MAASLTQLCECANHSWLQDLTPDPETPLHEPNKQPREVRSGHYVRVRPTPLPNAKLIIHSPAVSGLLGICKDTVSSESFTGFFSGHQQLADGLESWCTPYALAIMGRRMVSNCPFGNGNGYGDGRAISVGEVVVKGQRWEMQLKGAGRTPFCRGGDGRAVLRSSIREFLASEAMHSLGVETTRALALVTSTSETVQRPWYSNRNNWLRGMSRDPDEIITEPCAITTRVAPSFLRVGHIDLFARRAAQPDASEAERKELAQIVEHAIFREYPHIPSDEPLPTRAIAMLEAAADRFARLVANWLRVGFCQGNFNSDNCLVGGRTMDYGPFGWIDKYDPLFAKWTGSGEHYSFMNQPEAAIANYHTLVTSVSPILGSDMHPKVVKLLQAGADKIRSAAQDVFGIKMGFKSYCCAEAAILWQDLEPLLRVSDVDYTIFWRQLAVVVEATDDSDGVLVSVLRDAFYAQPTADLVPRWVSWLKRWRKSVVSEEGGGGVEAVAARLRSVNPKYVPREWMLAAAYKEASHGRYEVLEELYKLFLNPYDEQPKFEQKYYCRAPDEALAAGGLAYMS